MNDWTRVLEQTRRRANYPVFDKLAHLPHRIWGPVHDTVAWGVEEQVGVSVRDLMCQEILPELELIELD